MNRRYGPGLRGLWALAFVAVATEAHAGFGVQPLVTCVDFDEFTNQIVVHWGYDNTNGVEVTVESAFNFFVPGPSHRNQFFTFPAGRAPNAFTTISDAGTSITWVLGEFFATAQNDPTTYCGRVFVKGQPTLVAATPSVAKGSPPARVVLATAVRPDGPSAALTATIPPGLPSGIAATGLAIDAAGVVSATVAAGASVTPGTYPLEVLVSIAGTYPAVAEVTLTVASACETPAITSQTSRRFGSDGTTVVFSASATGTPAPAAQWQRSTDDGLTFANVPGATAATLVVPYAPASGDAYRATFSNLCGAVTTAAATEPALDRCLQHGVLGNHIRFSSATGDYVFTRCTPALAMAGAGRVAASGDVVRITDAESDRRVTITTSADSDTGDATITLLGARIPKTYGIHDHDRVEACGCP